MQYANIFLPNVFSNIKQFLPFNRFKVHFQTVKEFDVYSKVDDSKSFISLAVVHNSGHYGNSNVIIQIMSSPPKYRVSL